MRKLFPLITALLLTATLTAQTPTPKISLLALSKVDHTLAIIDPATLTVIARLPVGDDPHEVVASADGRTAYVSNYGFGQYHSLAVLDLIAQKPLAPVELGALRGPHGLDYADNKVWFTAETAKAIGSYNPATKTIDWIMGTGQNRTHMLYVFPDAKKILTTNVSSGTVTILEKVGAITPAGGMVPGRPIPGPPGGDWVETVIPVGPSSEGFDVTPDGKYAWVAAAGDGTVDIIDITAKKVIATIAAHANGVNRLKITPDGKLALLSTPTDVVVLDTATRSIVKHIATGHGGGGVLIQPDGKLAYESCAGDNYIAVIDLATLTVTAHLNVGNNPDGLAWAVQQ